MLPVFNSLTLERAFLFGFFFWLGTLMDMTVESWVPVDRLTAEDINRQPGGLVAVVILVLVVAACALAQLWAIRKTGWLLFYLKWYAVGGIVLGILSALPDLQLRLYALLLRRRLSYVCLLTSLFNAVTSVFPSHPASQIKREHC